MGLFSVPCVRRLSAAQSDFWNIRLEPDTDKSGLICLDQLHQFKHNYQILMESLVTKRLHSTINEVGLVKRLEMQNDK